MAKLTTLYWRDIPAQVTASERREKVKILLSERFAVAIDKAAMRAGMAGSDAYLEQWRRVSVKCDKNLQSVVNSAAKKIESDYIDDYLTALVANKGVKPSDR